MAENEEVEVPILSRLRPPMGAVRPKKRKGRGVGSGLGKTAGKGQKGQKARNPGDFGKLAFVGGQTPLQRQMPKMGFHNRFAKTVAEVNVGELARFDAGHTVDEAALRDAGLVKGACDVIKILGNGDLDKALTLKVHACSKGARAKIEKAGGTIEVIGATST